MGQHTMISWTLKGKKELGLRRVVILIIALKKPLQIIISWINIGLMAVVRQKGRNRDMVVELEERWRQRVVKHRMQESISGGRDKEITIEVCRRVGKDLA